MISNVLVQIIQMEIQKITNRRMFVSSDGMPSSQQMYFPKGLVLEPNGLNHPLKLKLNV